MGKFTPRTDLDLVVARMIAPSVNRIAHEVVADTARKLAPPTKTWATVGDDAVRRTHVEAEGQEVADNVRFKLTAFEWDVQHPGASYDVPIKRGDGSGWTGPDARTVPGVHTYLLEPRDPTGGAFVQIVNCRCSIVTNPEGVARFVKVDEAVPVGTRVTATVYAEGEIPLQAEHGDLYPFPVSIPVAKGTLFMHRAAVQAANTLRARQ